MASVRAARRSEGDIVGSCKLVVLSWDLAHARAACRLSATRIDRVSDHNEELPTRNYQLATTNCELSPQHRRPDGQAVNPLSGGRIDGVDERAGGQRRARLADAAGNLGARHDVHLDLR